MYNICNVCVIVKKKRALNTCCTISSLAVLSGGDVPTVCFMTPHELWHHMFTNWRACLYCYHSDRNFCKNFMENFSWMRICGLSIRENVGIIRQRYVWCDADRWTQHNHVLTCIHIFLWSHCRFPLQDDPGLTPKITCPKTRPKFTSCIT